LPEYAKKNHFCGKVEQKKKKKVYKFCFGLFFLTTPYSDISDIVYLTNQKTKGLFQIYLLNDFKFRILIKLLKIL